MSQEARSVYIFSPCIWVGTRSAQILMQSDSFPEHAQNYTHLAYRGLNCHWQSLLVVPSFWNMIWIEFV